MKAKIRYRRLAQWATRIVRMLLWVRKEGEAPQAAPKADKPAASGKAQAGEAIPWAPGQLSATETKLLEELRAAHREWACARHRLNYALHEDEIDYAIFALETAEKRYGMLIKQAKLLNLRAASVLRPPFQLYDPIDRG